MEGSLLSFLYVFSSVLVSAILKALAVVGEIILEEFIE